MIETFMLHANLTEEFGIPRAFLYDPCLTASQKIICSQIHSHQISLGYCAVTNAYLAGITGLGKEAAAANIKKLLSKRVLDHAQGHSNGIRRLKMHEDYFPDANWRNFGDLHFFQSDQATIDAYNIRHKYH